METAQSFLAFVRMLDRRCGSEGQKACLEFIVASIALMRKRIRSCTEILVGKREVLDYEPEASQIRKAAERVLSLTPQELATPAIFRTAAKDPLDLTVQDLLTALAHGMSALS